MLTKVADEVNEAGIPMSKVVPDTQTLSIWRNLISCIYSHPTIIFHDDFEPLRELFWQYGAVHETQCKDIIIPLNQPDDPHHALSPQTLGPPSAPLNFLFGGVKTCEMTPKEIRITQCALTQSMKDGMAELIEFIRVYPAGIREESQGFLLEFLVRFGVLPDTIDEAILHSTKTRLRESMREAKKELMIDIGQSYESSEEEEVENSAQDDCDSSDSELRSSDRRILTKDQNEGEDDEENSESDSKSESDESSSDDVTSSEEDEEDVYRPSSEKKSIFRASRHYRPWALRQKQNSNSTENQSERRKLRLRNQGKTNQPRLPVSYKLKRSAAAAANARKNKAGIVHAPSSIDANAEGGGGGLTFKYRPLPENFKTCPEPSCANAKTKICFQTRDSVFRHYKYKHPNDPVPPEINDGVRYPCTACKKSCKYENVLIMHYIRVHRIKVNTQLRRPNRKRSDQPFGPQFASADSDMDVEGDDDVPDAGPEPDDGDTDMKSDAEDVEMNDEAEDSEMSDSGEEDDEDEPEDQDAVDTEPQFKLVSVPRYNCPHCTEIFPRREALEIHVAKEHPTAEPLGEKLRRVKMLVFKKVNPKPVFHFACTICPNSYTTPYSLRRHFKQVHPTEFLKTETEVKEKVKRKGHGKAKRYPCDQCEVDFASRERLEVHLIKKHPEQVIVDRSKMKGQEVKPVVIANTSPNQVKPEVMDKKSPKQVESEVKPEKPEDPPIRKGKVKVKPKKRYPCTQCTKDFSRGDRLMGHLIKAHPVKVKLQAVNTSTGPLSCPHCHTGCSYSSSALAIHLNRFHPNEDQTVPAVGSTEPDMESSESSSDPTPAVVSIDTALVSCDQTVAFEDSVVVSSETTVDSNGPDMVSVSGDPAVTVESSDPVQVSIDALESTDVTVVFIDPDLELGDLTVEAIDPAVELGDLTVEAIDPAVELGDLTVESIDPAAVLGDLTVESIDPAVELGDVTVESADQAAESGHTTMTLDDLAVSPVVVEIINQKPHKKDPRVKSEPRKRLEASASCPVCSRTFPQRYNLHRHFRKLHPDIEPASVGLGVPERDPSSSPVKINPKAEFQSNLSGTDFNPKTYSALKSTDKSYSVNTSPVKPLPTLTAKPDLSPEKISKAVLKLMPKLRRIPELTPATPEPTVPESELIVNLGPTDETYSKNTTKRVFIHHKLKDCPFCPICRRIFSARKCLKAHFMSVHTDERLPEEFQFIGGADAANMVIICISKATCSSTNAGLAELLMMGATTLSMGDSIPANRLKDLRAFPASELQGMSHQTILIPEVEHIETIPVNDMEEGDYAELSSPSSIPGIAQKVVTPKVSISKVSNAVKKKTTVPELPVLFKPDPVNVFPPKVVTVPEKTNTSATPTPTPTKTPVKSELVTKFKENPDLVAGLRKKLCDFWKEKQKRSSSSDSQSDGPSKAKIPKLSPNPESSAKLNSKSSSPDIVNITAVASKRKIDTNDTNSNPRKVDTVTSSMPNLTKAVTELVDTNADDRSVLCSLLQEMTDQVCQTVAVTTVKSPKINVITAKLGKNPKKLKIKLIDFRKYPKVLEKFIQNPSASTIEPGVPVVTKRIGPKMKFTGPPAKNGGKAVNTNGGKGSSGPRVNGGTSTSTSRVHYVPTHVPPPPKPTPVKKVPVIESSSSSSSEEEFSDEAMESSSDEDYKPSHQISLKVKRARKMKQIKSNAEESN